MVALTGCAQARPVVKRIPPPDQATVGPTEIHGVTLDAGVTVRRADPPQVIQRPRGHVRDNLNRVRSEYVFCILEVFTLLCFVKNTK